VRAHGTLIAVLVAGLFALPLAALVLQAVGDEWRYPDLLPQRFGLRGFRAAVASGAAGAAFVNSLLIAIGSTALALVLGWPAARALGEGRLKRPGPLLLLLAVPLLVPSFATGTGLTTWFLRLGLTDSLAGLVLAHLTVVLPYVVLVLASGFGRRLRELEEMATIAGAPPARRLILVSIPASRATIAAAAILGFLVSWSQYGLSLAVGGGIPTLPIVMLPFTRNDPEVAAAIALIFLAPAFLALAGATSAGRRTL
jgi:putative spermidine/putrescine transport system permease protein